MNCVTIYLKMQLLFFVIHIYSPSLGGPVPLYQPPTPAADLVHVNNEQTTGSRVARDSESTSVWTQSSDTSTTPPSTDSEGSDDH